MLADNTQVNKTNKAASAAPHPITPANVKLWKAQRQWGGGGGKGGGGGENRGGGSKLKDISTK